MAHPPISNQNPKSRSSSVITKIPQRSTGTTPHARRSTHSAWRAGSLILPVIAALLIMAAGPKMGHAQKDTVISNYPGATGHCTDTSCCFHFTFYVEQPGAHCFTVILTPTSSLSDPSCLDWACLQAQIDTLLGSIGVPPNSITYTNENNGTSAGFKICWTGAGGQFPVPDTFDLYLCGTIQCVEGWDNFYFYDDNNSNYADDPLPEAWICQTPVPCSGCNNISVQDNGCFVDVCIQNNGGFVYSYTLNFAPPLAACNLHNTTGGGGCAITNLTPPTGWGYDYDPTTGNLFLYDNGGPSPGNCGTICFEIPKCSPGTHYNISLVNPNPCPGYTVSPVMKTATGNEETSDGKWTVSNNYPNPVDAASGFKTTIPFATSSNGTAYLRIVNAKGDVVLTDNEELSFAGKHFFYISARQLPAGTYYYQIEFPKGEVIVNRTMIVVK